MKVKECEKCVLYKRVCYSKSYKPANYHVIGMSWAFGYCKRYKKRCSQVKKCDPRGV